MREPFAFSTGYSVEGNCNHYQVTYGGNVYEISSAFNDTVVYSYENKTEKGYYLLKNGEVCLQCENFTPAFNYSQIKNLFGLELSNVK